MLPVEQSEPRKERSCDSLMMCIVTTLNYGLRNGGGIGDVLRSPSNTEPLFPARVIYDMLFFFLVIIIVLNLIFGVIIDTFADLRAEKQEKEETLKNSCFICGKTFRQLLFICYKVCEYAQWPFFCEIRYSTFQTFMIQRTCQEYDRIE